MTHHRSVFWLPLLMVTAACSGEVRNSSPPAVDAGTGGGGGAAGTGGTTTGSGGIVGTGGTGGLTGSGGFPGTGGTAGGGTGGTAGGGTGGSAGSPPPGQNILFEVAWENFAWAPTMHGIFVADDGNVFSYATDLSGQIPPPPPPHATEDEIRARWSTITGPIAQVPMNELLRWYGALETIAGGVLKHSHLCADAGARGFYGYLYDPATALYSRIIAGVDGDYAAKNTAPVAEDLVNWLAGLEGGDRFCEFMGAQCDGAICNSLPPDCPPGRVPSVENGCWGPCVDVGRCDQVPDCTWCTDICAREMNGTAHCLPLVCSGPPPCECPMSPCGGGSDYCTMGSGFDIVCGST